MTNHDPLDPHDLPEYDPTAQWMRTRLDAAGRDVHAPAGIAAAALRGGRRRRRQRRAALAAPMAFVAVGVAGLSWQQPWGGGQVRTVPVAEQVRDGREAAGTVAGVTAQLPNEDGVGVAQEMLIDRCLSAQGLDVERGPVTVDATNPLAQAVMRSSVANLSAWSAHGNDYGMASSIRAAVEHPGAGELGPFIHGIPTGYQQAVYGDPPVELTVPIENNGSVTVSTTGCYGQAVEQLYGTSVETYTRTYLTLRSLPEQLLEQVATDDAVKTPLHDWSQCMGARGHDVVTPADLPQQLQNDRRDLLLRNGKNVTEADLTAFTTAESALATADRDCKDTSALAGAFAQTLTRHWTQLTREHADDLAAYRVMVDHARAVAADVNPR